MVLIQLLRRFFTLELDQFTDVSKNLKASPAPPQICFLAVPLGHK